MTSILQILFILPSIIIFVPTAAAINGYSSDPSSYLAPSMPQQQDQQPPPYNLSTLLYTLGFHDLSTVAGNSTTTTTIFAATDDSLRSCPSCSLPLLLQEHSVSGLYPFRLLTALTFGTKIETLASTSAAPFCLTLTKSSPENSTVDPTLFIGGVEITRPDLFNDGNVIIHGIQGFLAHLSPFSCKIERMTSLSFPAQPISAAPESIMPVMLKDAIIRLRINDYTVLSLMMQQNLDRLLGLKSMTVFAVDDAGVFSDGHTYVSSLRFHIVPNHRLMAGELFSLPVNTELPTMERGERLVVTVAGGGGPLSPMRINNIKITSTDIVYNEGIVVHGIAGPFPRVHQTTMGYWPDQTEVINVGPTVTSDTY